MSEPKPGTRHRRFSFRHFCRGHNFRPITVIFALTVVVVLVCAVIGMGVSLRMQSKVTSLGFRDIGFLETQAGYYTEVQSLEKARTDFGFTFPGTKSQYVFTYDGVITAGIDFSQIEWSVDKARKEIHVKLPEVVVNKNELDNNSFKVLSESKNIFTPLKPDDMNNAQIQMKEESEKKAIENGLLENAEENAKRILKGFLAGAYDMNEYTLIYD